MLPTLGFLGISFDPTGVLVSLLGGIGNLFIGFFSYLIGEVNQLLDWLVSLIPPLPIYNAAWPSISSAITYVLSGNGTTFLGLTPLINAWNYYVALSLAIVMFFTALGAESALAAWKFIRWLLTHLPFGLGGGE